MVVLANLGGTFGAGMLLQQGYRPYTLLSTGFVAMLCSSYLVFAANSWLSFELQVVSAVLFSLIGGMIPTTVFAITLHYAPRAYAAAASVGLVLQISACAQFFIPTLSAALISATQYWANLAIITVCLSMLGMVMTAYLFKRYPK